MAQSHARPSETRHRRETWLRLVLPFALLVLLVAGGAAATALLPLPAQVSVVADWMLSVLMLCPLAVCMLPLTILVIVGVFGLNQAHDALARPLHKLEDYSVTMTQRTQAAAEKVSEAAIDVSARFGYLHKLLGTFEEQPDHIHQGEDGQDED